jgi:hypothetical protein
MLGGQHDYPEACGRNISYFPHVEDDPWISPIDGGDGSRLQIRAGQGVDFPGDTAQRHSVRHFVPDFQFKVLQELIAKAGDA